MTDERTIRAYYEQLLDKLDIGTALKRFFFGGFDSFDDYEKYGDLFTPIRFKSPLFDLAERYLPPLRICREIMRRDLWLEAVVALFRDTPFTEKLAAPPSDDMWLFSPKDNPSIDPSLVRIVNIKTSRDPQ